MALVVQVAVTGLAAGAVYGLIAIAIALVYRLTGVIHFALGELIGLSVFVTLWLAAGTGPVTATNLPGGRFLLSLAGGLALAVVTGALSYLVCIRPFQREGASMLGWIAALVALAFAVRGLLSAVLTRQGSVFPDPIPFQRLSNRGVLLLGGGVTLQVRTFFVIGVGLALAAASSAFLRRSRTGTALRAISLDREAAGLLGLPVERLLVGAFAATGALAAVAGVVAAPSSAVTADTGALLGLKGLAAALLGRFGSPWTVFVAGLGVGVLETSVASLHLGGIRLGPAWRDLIPLAMAIAVMAARRARELAAETE